MHDRDTKFTKEFVATLKAKGIRTNALPVASPNLNGRVERFIQTIKYECLLKFILFGRRHVDHIVTEWVAYYNQVRSHMERGHLPPIREAPEQAARANLQYLRHDRTFVILATKGEHPFFQDEAAAIRDLRQRPYPSC